jgi:hypothetical protein
MSFHPVEPRVRRVGGGEVVGNAIMALVIILFSIKVLPQFVF